MAIQRVAFNVDSKVYLRKSSGGWYTTNDHSAAYAASDEKLRSAIVDVGHSIPGRWEIMKASDANKMYPRRDPIVHIPISLYGKQKHISASSTPLTTPRSEECEKILSAVRSLSELISDEHMKDISRRQSEADKTIANLYHSIEVSNFNAAQGYLAYRKLREALVTRRKVKNEHALALRLRQTCLSDVSTFENLSSRAWEPEVDIFAEDNNG